MEQSQFRCIKCQSDSKRIKYLFEECSNRKAPPLAVLVAFFLLKESIESMHRYWCKCSVFIAENSIRKWHDIDIIVLPAVPHYESNRMGIEEMCISRNGMVDSNDNIPRHSNKCLEHIQHSYYIHIECTYTQSTWWEMKTQSMRRCDFNREFQYLLKFKRHSWIEMFDTRNVRHISLLDHGVIANDLSMLAAA